MNISNMYLIDPALQLDVLKKKVRNLEDILFLSLLACGEGKPEKVGRWSSTNGYSSNWR